MRVAIVLALCLFGVALTSAAVYEGTASSSSGFAYLGKFCFRQSAVNTTISGTIGLTFNNPPDPAQNFWIALYDDQQSSWYSVWKQGLTCAQSLPYARNYFQMSGTEVIFGDDAMAPLTIEESTRPRFWWVALVNCYTSDAQSFSGVKYNVHFLQQGMGPWTQEFGINEMGLNSQYLVCFFFFFFLLVAQCYSVKQMMATRVHPLVRLYTGSLVCQFFSVMFYLAHYGKYAKDGIGAPGAAALGEVLDAAARITLVIFLILLAQGWTIVTDVLQHRYLVLSAGAALSITYFAFIIWDLTGRDQVTTLYVYDGAAGYFICVLITVCAIWFAIAIARSYANENDPVKSTLFLRMGVTFFMWFLSMPLIVLIALAIDPWDREKVVSGLLITVALVAYNILTFVLWHSRSAQYFKLDTPDLHTAMRDENL